MLYVISQTASLMRAGSLSMLETVPSIVLHVTVQKPTPNEFHLRMVLSETASKCGTIPSQGVTRVFGMVDVDKD